MGKTDEGKDEFFLKETIKKKKRKAKSNSRRKRLDAHHDPFPKKRSESDPHSKKRNPETPRTCRKGV